eukprot:3748630-Prymnesium_polylepis.1
MPSAAYGIAPAAASTTRAAFTVARLQLTATPSKHLILPSALIAHPQEFLSTIICSASQFSLSFAIARSPGAQPQPLSPLTVSPPRLLGRSMLI